MNHFNIIDLIEKNPISILSNTYNNKFLIKIKENFTYSEQQLFVSSLYCYLNYDNIKDLIIDFDDIWKWLGFSNKDKAKRALIKNFIIDVDYKFLLTPIGEQKKEGRGGHNREIILMNINTFKLLCIKSETKKANEIHNYLLKLEKLLQDIIIEQSNEFKKLLEKKENEIINIEKQNYILQKNNKLEKHNLLLQEYGISSPLIYIVRVKTYDDNSYVIKIGESRKGISDRYSEHKSKYEECEFLDCFRVLRSKDFESFLHSHEKIRLNIVKNLIGHENEKELFLIGKELTYKILINIINTNIKNYDNFINNYELEKLKLENENLKLIIELEKKFHKDINILEYFKINKDILLKLELLEKTNHNLEKSNKEILEKLNNIQTKNDSLTNFGEVNKNIGNRIQKINPDNGNLVKYYESISEIFKEDSTLKRSSIAKAIKENIIYHGFRWMEINRELNPKIILNYKPSKQILYKSLGFIAKLNKEKTEIINVYIDRKTASLLNEYPASSSLDNIVKNKTESNGHFYILYSDCDNYLKNNFEKKIGKVLLFKNGIGKYDQNNILLNEYISKYDCVKENCISDRTLKKALDNNIAYNGYFYKYLQEKVKCL